MHCQRLMSLCNTHKKLYLLVTNDLVHQNLFCGTLICPLLIWQLGLKLECICWTVKSDSYAFLRSTDILQVLNDVPTDKRYTEIHVPQDGDCYALHTSTARKTRFSKKIIGKCITQPDLSGFPFNFLSGWIFRLSL